MIVSNLGSDQSSKLLMKRTYTLSKSLFIKNNQKTKTASCKVKISLLGLSCTLPNEVFCYTFAR